MRGLPLQLKSGNRGVRLLGELHGHLPWIGWHSGSEVHACKIYRTRDWLACSSNGGSDEVRLHHPIV